MPVDPAHPDYLSAPRNHPGNHRVGGLRGAPVRHVNPRWMTNVQDNGDHELLMRREKKVLPCLALALPCLAMSYPGLAMS
jgi:hypothetical protein